jgi:hypothetical protein
MQGNVVKAAVWLGASMVLASVILVVGLYAVVASQAQRLEQASLKVREPVETTVKFSGLEQLNQGTYEGITLPSAKYMTDDVKPIPMLPHVKLSDASGAEQSARQEAETEEPEAASESPRAIPTAQEVEKLLNDAEALRAGVELTDPPSFQLNPSELKPFPVSRDHGPKPTGDDE